MLLKTNRHSHLWLALGLGLLTFLLSIALPAANTLAQVEATTAPSENRSYLRDQGQANNLQPAGTPSPSATPTRICSPLWQIVASPNTPGNDNRLSGMAAISPDDVWAVGIIGNGDSNSLPLMLHWQGTHWVNVPGPP